MTQQPMQSDRGGQLEYLYLDAEWLGDAMVSEDILGPSEAFRGAMDYFANSPHTGQMLERLTPRPVPRLGCRPRHRAHGGAKLASASFRVRIELHGEPGECPAPQWRQSGGPWLVGVEHLYLTMPIQIQLTTIC